MVLLVPVSALSHFFFAIFASANNHGQDRRQGASHYTTRPQMTNLISNRLLAQQLISQQFSEPEALVGWFGAMQAQESRLFRMAIAMRLKRPSLARVDEALADGRLVRLHLNRTTWQVVSAADVRWMLGLHREQIHRSVASFARSNGLAMDKATIGQSHRLMKEVLVGRHLDRNSLYELHRAAGIKISKHQLAYCLLLAEADGLVCSGPMKGRMATYALLDERVPPQPDISTEEKMERLARRYFQSHGAATLADFVWWTGLPKRLCKQGVEALGDAVRSEQHHGETYCWMQTARHRGFRRGRHLLLPSYDEYLIGYRSRHLVVPEGYAHKVDNHFGIFYPVILRDGMVVGNWKGDGKRGDYGLQQTYFDPADGPVPSLETYYRSLAPHL